MKKKPIKQNLAKKVKELEARIAVLETQQKIIYLPQYPVQPIQPWNPIMPNGPWICTAS